MLLSKLIECCLSLKDLQDKSNNVFDVMPKETLQELMLLAADMLGKAGLTEMNQKLKSI